MKSIKINSNPASKSCQAPNEVPVEGAHRATGTGTSLGNKGNRVFPDPEVQERKTRNGYLPQRDIQTGEGPVPAKVPRARDHQKCGQSDKIRFSSSIVPAYLKKTESMESLIPWLYLKGISTGDLSEALSALVEKGARGLSASTISLLKSIWTKEYNQWLKRNLSKKYYIYIWADGIYCNVRMDDRQCILVIIGPTRDGKKELIAVKGGYRKSESSWFSLLMDLKRRRPEKAPELAIGDGELGFRKALSKAFDTTKWQRCWVHKTANILNKLPQTLQKEAKENIHKIWMAPTRAEAEKSFDLFIKIYKAKYPKATQCLEKDRDVLLNFYDFPAEHWRHIRTSNPIESTFATVRLKIAKVRICFSSVTVLWLLSFVNPLRKGGFAYTIMKNWGC